MGFPLALHNRSYFMHNLHWVNFIEKKSCNRINKNILLVQIYCGYKPLYILLIQNKLQQQQKYFYCCSFNNFFFFFAIQKYLFLYMCQTFINYSFTLAYAYLQTPIILVIWLVISLLAPYFLWAKAFSEDGHVDIFFSGIQIQATINVGFSMTQDVKDIRTSSTVFGNRV